MSEPRRRNRVGQSKYSVRRLRAAQKQLQALNLRGAGASYNEIAHELGYKDHTGAYRAVDAGLKRVFEEPAERVRKLHATCLDAQLLRASAAARKAAKLGGLDKDAEHVISTNTDQRAKFYGLYAPVRIEPTAPLEIKGIKGGTSVDDLYALIKKTLADPQCRDIASAIIAKLCG